MTLICKTVNQTEPLNTRLPLPAAALKRTEAMSELLLFIIAGALLWLRLPHRLHRDAQGDATK
jgi:hypothetical protein